MADDEWRKAIREAIDCGTSVTAIAAAAGVSRERIYQIRDDRR
ncbi:helix-turn-helix domain-containing protein [Blastococcus sp. SYSU DS1021]